MMPSFNVSSNERRTCAKDKETIKIMKDIRSLDQKKEEIDTFLPFPKCLKMVFFGKLVIWGISDILHNFV